MHSLRALFGALALGLVTIVGCSDDDEDRRERSSEAPTPGAPQSATGEAGSPSGAEGGASGVPSGDGGNGGGGVAPRCDRFAAHVAACDNGDPAFYARWCAHYLQSCPDSHIESCIASSCAEVRQRCGYC